MPYNNLTLGQVVRLKGAHPEARPWTIIRLGTVGEGDEVATILRDASGGNVVREVVHVTALCPWDEAEEMDRRLAARRAYAEMVAAGDVDGEGGRD